VSLALKNPLKVDVIRDRGALAREARPGIIENVYQVQIMNTSERPQRFTMRVEGLPGIAIAGASQAIEVGPAATRLVPLRVEVPAEAAPPGTHRIELVVEAGGDAPMQRRESSTFILPRP
jgi:polyferredoxin